MRGRLQPPQRLPHAVQLDHGVELLSPPRPHRPWPDRCGRAEDAPACCRDPRPAAAAPRFVQAATRSPAALRACGEPRPRAGAPRSSAPAPAVRRTRGSARRWLTASTAASTTASASLDSRAERPATRQHHQHDHRDERQIHPALGPDFGRDRHDAGGRRQDAEEPHAEEARRCGAPEQRTIVAATSATTNASCVGHLAERQRLRPAVERDEVHRPDRQAQVVHDHGRLVQQIGRTAPRRPRSRPRPPAAPTMTGGQHEPRSDEAQVERPAFTERLAPARRQVRAIEKGDEHRRDDNRLLAQ